jgi:hypothetical protein
MDKMKKVIINDYLSTGLILTLPFSTYYGGLLVGLFNAVLIIIVSQFMAEERVRFINELLEKSKETSERYVTYYDNLINEIKKVE